MHKSIVCGVGILAGLGILPGTAAADSASWVAVTSGAASTEQRQLPQDFYPVLQLEAGMGTDPGSGFVFGGVAKTITQFGGGTDLVVSQRTTTSKFSLGSWGAALDLGVFQRSWAGGSYGFHGALTAGLPWGLNVGATTALGTEETRSFFLTLGFDWARLTAHRRDAAWWPSYPLPVPSARDQAVR